MAGAQEIYVTAYFIPLSVVSKWPLPKGKDAETRHWYVPYIITLMVISTISIFVRFYAQYTKRIRKTGIDDIFIMLAWIFAMAYTISTSWGVLHAGFDKHVWENIATGEQAGFIAYIAEIFFLASTCLSKLSILSFQRRLLQRTHNPRYTRAIDFAIGFTVIFWFAFFCFLLASCTPTNAAWKSMNIGYDVKYKCRHRNIPDLMVGILSVASDIYALIIPELLIYRLRLEKRTKIILCIVFGSGLLVVGAGIARTVWLERLFSDPLRDLTWVGYDTMVWGGTEVQFSIVCASAPALKAFISNVKAGLTRAGSIDKYYSRNDSQKTPRGFRIGSTIVSTMEESAKDGKRVLVTETATLRRAPLASYGTPMTKETQSPYMLEKELLGSIQMADDSMKATSTPDLEPWMNSKTTTELAPWESSKSLVIIEMPEIPPAERSLGSMSSETPSYSSNMLLNHKRPLYSARARAPSDSDSSISSLYSNPPPHREHLSLAEFLKMEK